MFNEWGASGWRWAAVLTGLFVFGLGYDWLIAEVERRGHDRGYTAFLVVGGTVATLAGSLALVGWRAAATIAACFVASGLPMIWGSVRRHVQQRGRDEAEARRVVEELLQDDDAA